jgi:hypothetical protein
VAKSGQLRSGPLQLHDPAGVGVITLGVGVIDAKMLGVGQGRIVGVAVGLFVVVATFVAVALTVCVAVTVGVAVGLELRVDIIATHPNVRSRNNATMPTTIIFVDIPKTIDFSP